MTHSLFAYGSLIYSEVISIVLDRPVRATDLCDAILEGYRRVAVPQRSYPTGIAQPESRIHGKIITGLSEEDLQRLDAYEESFYVRETVSVQTKEGMQAAFAYIDGRDPLPFPLREWNANRYEQEDLAPFIKTLRHEYVQRLLIRSRCDFLQS